MTLLVIDWRLEIRVQRLHFDDESMSILLEFATHSVLARVQPLTVRTIYRLRRRRSLKDEKKIETEETRLDRCEVHVVWIKQ